MPDERSAETPNLSPDRSFFAVTVGLGVVSPIF